MDRLPPYLLPFLFRYLLNNLVVVLARCDGRGVRILSKFVVLPYGKALGSSIDSICFPKLGVLVGSSMLLLLEAYAGNAHAPKVLRQPIDKVHLEWLSTWRIGKAAKA